jgi:hypothetical protein
MLRNSAVTEQLAASQEGLSCTELLSLLEPLGLPERLRQQNKNGAKLKLYEVE